MVREVNAQSQGPGSRALAENFLGGRGGQSRYYKNRYRYNTTGNAVSRKNRQYLRARAYNAHYCTILARNHSLEKKNSFFPHE